MEFCSSCRSIMIPKSAGSKTILVCRGCGRKLKNFSVDKYRITESNRRKVEDILVVEGGRKKSTEEERKYLIDLYGSDVYEAEE